MFMQLKAWMGAAMLGLPLAATAAAPVVQVYKSPLCGCCQEWIAHLRASGFAVAARDVESPGDYRQLGGIPDRYGSCHTAMVGGYAIEGHVPAADILHLLAQRPTAKGLAAPGMPQGAPGMEGGRRLPYDVFLIPDRRPARVYRHYD